MSGSAGTEGGGAQPSRPQTAQQLAHAQLRSKIVSGELQPGDPIRQEALAERKGTSRVPLREALKILEGEGQVTYRPHRGYVVTSLSIEDLLEVYRIRELLEGEAARQSAIKMSENDLALVVDAQREFERAHAESDIATLTSANRTFHFQLLEAAGMPRLMRLVRILWDATDVYRSINYNDETNRRQVIREHRAIIKAARGRDPEKLVDMLDAHRDAAVIALRRMLSNGIRPQPGGAKAIGQS
jgi:DNA-binding GntR family transcriptional regulator